MIELHPLIKNRKSTRVFSDKKIEKEKIIALFEAARWAASCFNEQPWRFVYAVKDNPDQFNNLFDCLVEGNKQWTKNAPLLMATIAKKTFSHNNKPNKHCWHDIGLAIGNLTLQALSMDLYLHQMAGFDYSKAIKNLEIKDGFEPVSFIAIGYMENLNTLPEKIKSMELSPRTRKNLNEILFEGKMN